MVQKKAILIGDDRFLFSIIRRWYPQNATLPNHPKPFFLNICTTPRKESAICIGFKKASERQIVIDEIDKHFGI